MTKTKKEEPAQTGQPVQVTHFLLAEDAGQWHWALKDKGAIVATSPAGAASKEAAVQSVWAAIAAFSRQKDAPTILRVPSADN